MTNPLFPFSNSEGLQKDIEQAAFMDDTDNMLRKERESRQQQETKP